MTDIFSLIFLTFWVFQWIFFYKKCEYYDLFEMPVSKLVLFILVVFPIFGAFVIWAHYGLTLSGTILVGILLAVGLMAITNLLIPIICKQFLPDIEVKENTTKKVQLFDLISLVASVLGILSFIFQYILHID